jgi:hypothetical protein
MEYEPLDASEDEIRLITLLPSRAESDYPEKLFCRLENHSLTDYTPHYNDFLTTASVASSGQGSGNASYAHLNTAWRLAQKAPLAADGSTVPEGLNLQSIWRFRWGDFAALSYTWNDPSLPEQTVYINGYEKPITGILHEALQHLRIRLRKGLKLWVDAICINQEDIEERNLQVKRMGRIYGEALNTIVWVSREGPATWKTFQFLRRLAEAQAKGPGDARTLITNETRRIDHDL